MKTVRDKAKTVFVAMSGGVDSSVAALLLKQQGYDVVGVFMKNWSESRRGAVWCTWEEDQRFARQAAEQIGIPFYTWDFEKEYRQSVFEYFLDGYKKGETPNPDVMCNKEIKFGLFLQKALRMGADFVATGHYVKMKRAQDGTCTLYKASDLNKDQSYFLWTLTQRQLRHCLFPAGAMTKPNLRAYAKKHGLINADRKDSQGLCFVGKVRFEDFLKAYIPPKQGDIIEVLFDAKGKRRERVIGTHQGIQFYTVGQRQGIGIGGGDPYFIVAKNAKTNALYVTVKKSMDRFFMKTIRVHGANWIGSIPTGSFPCMARYRYRQPLQRVTVTQRKGAAAVIQCAKTPTGIASGQSIVFYRGTRMLGGGIIA